MSRKSYKYWAFISYSSKDKKWGSWLHRRLENYPIPEDLRGTLLFDGAVLGKNLRPVFRDRDELSGAAELGPAIEDALQNSRYLIVLCSKNSAKSEWVNKEIEDYRRMGGEKRILALIIDGEPNATSNELIPNTEECFPQALRYPLEPLAGDLRKEGDGKERGFLKLLAGLADLDFDQLYKRHERSLQKKRRLLFCFAAAIIIALSSLTSFALHQKDQAEKNEAEALLQKKQAVFEKEKFKKLLLGSNLRYAQYEYTSGNRKEADRLMQMTQLKKRAWFWKFVWAKYHDEDFSETFPLVKTVLVNKNLAYLIFPDSLCIFDMEKKKVTLKTNINFIGSWKFKLSADAKHLMAKNNERIDNIRLKVWEINTGNLIYEKSILDYDYSAKQNKLYLVSQDKPTTIQSFDFNGELLDERIFPSEEIIQKVKCSISGKSLFIQTAIPNALNIHYVLDFESKTLRPLESQPSQDKVTEAVFSPNEDRLILKVQERNFSEIKRTGRIIDLSRETTASIDNLGQYDDIKFTPDGEYIIASKGNEVFILDKWGDIRQKMTEHDSKILNLSINSDKSKNFFLTASSNKIILWKYFIKDRKVNLKKVQCFVGFNSSLRQLKWINTDEFLSIDYEQNLKIWDLHKNSQKSLLKTRLSSITFMPKSDIIACSRENILFLRDKEGNFLSSYMGHQNDITALSFNNNGTLIASGSSSGNIRLWELNDNNNRVLKNKSGKVLALKFSPDNKRIISGTDDEKLIVWDLVKDSPIQIIKEHNEAVTALDYHPDGKSFISGSNDNSIIIWDAEKLTKIISLKDHKSAITDLKFSHDGKYFASASIDKTVKVWDTKTHKLIYSLTHLGNVTKIQFLPGGEELMTVSDENVQIWNLHTANVSFKLPKEHGKIINGVINEHNNMMIISELENSLKSKNISQDDAEILVTEEEVNETLNQLIHHFYSIDTIDKIEEPEKYKKIEKISNFLKLKKRTEEVSQPLIKFQKHFELIEDAVWDAPGKSIWILYKNKLELIHIDSGQIGFRETLKDTIYRIYKHSGEIILLGAKGLYVYSNLNNDPDRAFFPHKEIIDMSIDHSSSLIALLSKSGTIKIIDMQSMKSTNEINCPGAEKISFNYNSLLVAYMNSCEVYKLRTEDNQNNQFSIEKIKEIKTSGEISAVQNHLGFNFIISLKNGDIKNCLLSSDYSPTLMSHRGRVISISVADGFKAFSLDAEGRIKIWHLDDLNEIARVNPGKNIIKKFHVDNTGRHLLSLDSNNLLQYRDLEASKSSIIYNQHISNINHLAFSENYGLSSDIQGHVHLWERNTGAFLHEWKFSDGEIQFLGINRKFAVIVEGSEINVFEIEGKRPVSKQKVSDVREWLIFKGNIIYVNDKERKIKSIRIKGLDESEKLSFTESLLIEDYTQNYGYDLKDKLINSYNGSFYLKYKIRTNTSLPIGATELGASTGGVLMVHDIVTEEELMPIQFKDGYLQNLTLFKDSIYFASGENILVNNINHQVNLKPSSKVKMQKKLNYQFPFKYVTESLQWQQVPAGAYHIGGTQYLNPYTLSVSHPFWVLRHEVTQAHFKRFINDTGYQTSTFSGQVPRNGPLQLEGAHWFSYQAGNKRPVTAVSWEDANMYAKWLTNELRKEGLIPENYEVRLPTEGEWEIAFWAANRRYGVYLTDINYKSPREIEESRPNNWGIYDMYGNVSEWCLDSGTRRLPRFKRKLDFESIDKIVRGRSYLHSFDRRISVPKDSCSFDIGFRLVIGIEKNKINEEWVYGHKDLNKIENN